VCLFQKTREASSVAASKHVGSELCVSFGEGCRGERERGRKREGEREREIERE